MFYLIFQRKFRSSHETSWHLSIFVNRSGLELRLELWKLRSSLHSLFTLIKLVWALSDNAFQGFIGGEAHLRHGELLVCEVGVNIIILQIATGVITVSIVVALVASHLWIKRVVAGSLEAVLSVSDIIGFDNIFNVLVEVLESQDFIFYDVLQLADGLAVLT